MRFPKYEERKCVCFLRIGVSSAQVTKHYYYFDIEFPVISHMHIWNQHMVKNLQHWTSNIVSDFGSFISRVTTSNLGSLCKHTGTWGEEAARGPSPRAQCACGVCLLNELMISQIFNNQRVIYSFIWLSLLFLWATWNYWWDINIKFLARVTFPKIGRLKFIFLKLYLFNLDT